MLINLTYLRGLTSFNAALRMSLLQPYNAREGSLQRRSLSLGPRDPLGPWFDVAARLTIRDGDVCIVYAGKQRDRRGSGARPDVLSLLCKSRQDTLSILYSVFCPSRRLVDERDRKRAAAGKIGEGPTARRSCTCTGALVARGARTGSRFPLPQTQRGAADPRKPTFSSPSCCTCTFRLPTPTPSHHLTSSLPPPASRPPRHRPSTPPPSGPARAY